jgi:hypothetical protein
MTKLRALTRSSDVPLLLTGVLLLAAASVGCGSSVSALSKDGGGSGQTGSSGKTGSAGATGASGMTGGAGNGGAGSGFDGSTVGIDASRLPLGMTQCSDGIDNDGDGLIDSADPECTGPADNDEGTFATGIPGDNIDACKQDCFFDGNSGMGDDGCQWQLDCDPLNTDTRCPYSASFVSKHMMECSTTASQSQKCIDNCRKYVPNGCDCFGCCAIPGAPHPIRLDATCTAAKFNDPTACPPCTQVTQCMNPCDRCEICVGKPTVPEDCHQGGIYDGGPPPADGGTGGYDGPPPPPTPDGGGYATCSDGISCTPGAAGNSMCPSGYGCVYGCCTAVIP